MDLTNKRVVIVGGGKSGLAAARLAVRAGAAVVINDRKRPEEAGSLIEEARAIGASVELGGHPEALMFGADAIVISPGVPALPVIDEAERRGVIVIPEVELAATALSGALIGITGSNGKSTVATLVGKMVELDSGSGRPFFTGGNLGDALALAAFTDAARPEGVVIAELSSFQLERARSLRCHVAACLNITPNHLDRHGTFAEYAAAKGRIFTLQRRGDHAVVPDGDALCLSLARAGAGTTHTFGAQAGEVKIVDGELRDSVSGLRLPVSRLRIRGLHNQSNACAAALIARLAGVRRGAIEEALASFSGLPHRMELVLELDGIAYFDDSKATSVGATVAAIDALAERPGRIALIAGGVDKGGSYEPLRERMSSRGRAAILIGEAAPLIEGALGGAVPCIRARTMDEAVEMARSAARPGDVVLLAPACASFDMFRSYAHRGDEFARAVRALSSAPPSNAPPSDAEVSR